MAGEAEEWGRGFGMWGQGALTAPRVQLQVGAPRTYSGESQTPVNEVLRNKPLPTPNQVRGLEVLLPGLGSPTFAPKRISCL